MDPDQDLGGPKPCGSGGYGSGFYRIQILAYQLLSSARSPSSACDGGKVHPASTGFAAHFLEETLSMFTSLYSFNFYAQNGAYGLQRPVKKNRPDKLNLRGKEDPFLGIQNLIF
jgi:hypothetical protein